MTLFLTIFLPLLLVSNMSKEGAIENDTSAFLMLLVKQLEIVPLYFRHIVQDLISKNCSKERLM